MGTASGPAPPDAPAPGTPHDIPAGRALRHLIGAHLDELRADLPRALAGEAEAVHRMRSALRRLRAILRAFRPVLPASVAPRERALRRLGQVLGPARDWDVFLDETLPLAAADGVPPIALAALRRAATARRRTAYARLRRTLPGVVGETAAALRDWSEALVAAPPLAAPLGVLAPDLLARLARRLRGGARVIARGQREPLHRLRKRTRRLRDAMAALSPPQMDPKGRDRAARRALAASRHLAARLGRMNDAATAASLAARLGGPGGAGPAPAALLSDWAARVERDAIRHLPKAWRRLRQCRDRLAGSPDRA